MKGTDLFYGMNYVDDVYILEAGTWKQIKKGFTGVFLVCSVAAAIVIACALILAAFFRSEFQKDRPLEDIPTLKETETEETKYYVYEIENKKIDEAEFRLWLEEEGYILPEETIREMGYEIGNDLEGDEQTKYRGMIAHIGEDWIIIEKNDMSAAYPIALGLSDEVTWFKYQDFYLRNLFPESEIVGYPAERAEQVFMPILEKMGLTYESRDVYVVDPAVLKKSAEIEKIKLGREPLLPEYDPEMKRGGRYWQDDDIAYLFVYRNQELDGKYVSDNNMWCGDEHQAEVWYSPNYGLIRLEAEIPVDVKEKAEVSIISEKIAIQRANEAESLSRFEKNTYTITGAELVYSLDNPQFEYDEDWNLISRTDTCSPYWKLIVEPMNGIDEWFPVEAEMFSEEIELEYDNAYVLIPAVEESND